MFTKKPTNPNTARKAAPQKPERKNRLSLPADHKQKRASSPYSAKPFSIQETGTPKTRFPKIHRAHTPAATVTPPGAQPAQAAAPEEDMFTPRKPMITQSIITALAAARKLLENGDHTGYYQATAAQIKRANDGNQNISHVLTTHQRQAGRILTKKPPQFRADSAIAYGKLYGEVPQAEELNLAAGVQDINEATTPSTKFTAKK